MSIYVFGLGSFGKGEKIIKIALIGFYCVFRIPALNFNKIKEVLNVFLHLEFILKIQVRNHDADHGFVVADLPIF